MKTLKDFLENQAEDLLQQADLAELTGGDDLSVKKDINGLADCSTTNNCHAGNCFSQCGCSAPTTPSVQ